MNAAEVSQIIKTHKLSENMLRALYTGEDGEPVACTASTERALIARELIHPTESMLTPKGAALIAELRAPRVATPKRPARTAADLPAGTRVTTPEGRTGTVNGYDIGRVANSNHPNYGREYVGVELDPIEGAAPGTGRTRQFVDELRIDRLAPEASTASLAPGSAVAR
ncbi:hypothetical protein [Streptomyces incanus]|uniref:Uncharacterized protein n=1 Tax=Streptomyces incanus TaxID=887453 RepID=A0ABW0XLR7_9ACTN